MRKATIAGTGLWSGVGFQNQAIFADHLGEWWGALLGNGMTADGLTAIALTLFMELTGPRSRRIETALDVEALPEVTGFLREFASRRSWGDGAVRRLCSAGEETLLSLVRPEGGAVAGEKRRLLVIARDGRKAAELEFIAAPGEENLEDRMVLLTERGGGAPAEREISLRLLRHYAASVHHQQYHDTDCRRCEWRAKDANSAVRRSVAVGDPPSTRNARPRGAEPSSRRIERPPGGRID